jgi:uncharacterized protein
MTYNSITFGRLTEEEVLQKIAQEIALFPNNEFVLTVGTDSHSHSKTKIVSVIALHRVGNGGKFFYSTEYLGRINDIRYKVYQETLRSIDMAKRITEFLIETELNLSVVIHVDIGENKKGKTYNLIKEISGWVQAEGFEIRYKPESSTASTIADRLTK